MDKFTDLVTEFGQKLTQKNNSCSEVKTDCGVTITRTDIRSEEFALKLGQRCGLYYTLEEVSDEADIANQMAVAIKSYDIDFSKVLIVGLGNPTYEADSLGTYVSDMIELIPDRLLKFLPMTSARTGIESHDLIKAVVDKIKPTVVIAIDSLATIAPKRIGKCYQITSAGLVPGSGVGNDRQILGEDTLGVSVLAIGVPFVCDMRRWASRVEVLPNMVVTPSHIDTLVSRVASNIAKAIMIVCGEH